MILIYPYHNGFNQPSPHPYEFSHQKENRLRLWVVPFFIGESLQTSELRFLVGLNLFSICRLSLYTIYLSICMHKIAYLTP